MQGRQPLHCRARRIQFEILEDRHMLSAPGDYDGNGMIDTNDYDEWVAAFGSTVAHGSGADGNEDGIVDAADYTVWRDQLGGTGPVDSINIAIDGLAEAVEETPGAIIWRNNDFSKQSLAAMQPEPGEPSYVPDYMAPSTVFDPASAMDFTSGSISFDADMLGQYDVEFTFDSEKIRLWTTTQWTGMTDVGGGNYQIPTGVTLTPAANSLNFLIEGLESSAAFATDSILVEAIPTGGGATLSDTGIYTVVETGAGVDGNRDNQIEVDNNHDRQLLFWINNDQEGNHPSNMAVEAEEPEISTADNLDNVIGQRRDLEDLAPLRVNVDPLLIQNAFDTAGGGMPDPGQLQVTYRLNLINPGGATLRLFYSNNEQADVIRHVSDENTANLQATDSFFRMAAGPSFATSLQLEQISEGLNAFLFEAIGATYGSTFTVTPTLEFETIIEYANGTTTSRIQAIEIDLRDIKQFYTRWDIDYGVNGGSPGTDLRLDPDFMDFATPTTPTHQSQVTDVTFWDSDETVVFVHGWNVLDDPMEDEKAAFAETMLKRLYWQGFRGEFVAFNWPTFADREAGLNFFGFEESIEWLALSYNPSDFQAYRSANALKEVLAGYRGEAPDLKPVHLLAHSMGNIVASEALRIWTYEIPFNDDPLVTNYVAMNGAVSAGAWGDDGTDSRIIGRPIPDLYRFWSHGRDGFSDPSLGILEYFVGADFAAENMVNMYNEDDYALSWWDYNNFLKGERVQSAVWPYDYVYFVGAGGNTNTDTFRRVPDVGPNVDLTLTLPNGRPGQNAYEILAFFSESASLPIGTKQLDEFDTDINIKSYGMLHGSDIHANHSYQFNHDAAETWQFYNDVKSETGFLSTHDSGFPGSAAVAAKADEVLEQPVYVPNARTSDSDMLSSSAVALWTSATSVSDKDVLLLIRESQPVYGKERDALDEVFAQWNDENDRELSSIPYFDLTIEPLLS